LAFCQANFVHQDKIADEKWVECVRNLIKNKQTDAIEGSTAKSKRTSEAGRMAKAKITNIEEIEFKTNSRRISHRFNAVAFEVALPSPQPCGRQQIGQGNSLCRKPKKKQSRVTQSSMN